MELQRKDSIKSFGGSNRSSRSASFDFDQDQDRERREIVVKINDDVGQSSFSLSSAARGGPSAGYGAVPGSGGSSAPASPTGAGRFAESFSFKNRPPESPPSPTSPQGECSDDPPSRLIGNFLRKQAAAGGEMSLDPELEMEEMRRLLNAPTPISTSRVSFQQDPRKRFCPSSTTAGSSSSSSDAGGGGNGRKKAAKAGAGADNSEVIRCTSTSTGGGLLPRSKTRSRLMDPPPPLSGSTTDGEQRNDRKSFVMQGAPPKSGQLRSGFIGRSGLLGTPRGGLDDEDDDPFVDEGLNADSKRDTVDCLIILEWVGLIVIIASLVCSVTIPTLAKKKLSGLHLWKWELLVCVLICGRLVSGWIIRMAVFFVERNFLLRKKVLYFVYGVRRAVRNVL